MDENLEAWDVLFVKQLKYLRVRSMSNPKWRDPAAVGHHLRGRTISALFSDAAGWPTGSPLEREVRQAQRLVREAEHLDNVAKQRHSAAQEAQAVKAWAEVVASVDAIIERAELLAGHKISPRP